MRFASSSICLSTIIDNNGADVDLYIRRVKLCLIRCGFVSLNFSDIKHGVQASFKVKFLYL